jgi:hypothetical protein
VFVLQTRTSLVRARALLSFVDDLLQAGTPEFRMDMEREFKQAFDMYPYERGNFTFVGVQAATGHSFSLNKIGYLNRLSVLPTSATFELSVLSVLD